VVIDLYELSRETVGIADTVKMDQIKR